MSPSNNGAVFIPFYGISSCAVTLIRTDSANTAGDVLAQTIIPKVWDYESMILQSDTPTALYGFPSVQQPGDVAYGLGLSTASAAVEASAGGAMTLVGGTLQPSTLPVSRLQGKSWMLPPAVQATHVFTSITPQENAGLPWAVEGWIFRNASTGAAIIYLETNAGVTSYLNIQMSATGVLSLIKSGVTAWTDTVSVPVGVWSHFALSSSGTAITRFLSNVATGGPTAYAHATGITADRTILNSSGLGQHYSANFSTYRTALTLAQWDRHNLMVAGGDYYASGDISQGGTIQQGGSVQVVFTNDAIPGFSTPSVATWGMLLPLQGIGLVWGLNGEYRYEIHTEEADV